jgi:hypothetical protein
MVPWSRATLRYFFRSLHLQNYSEIKADEICTTIDNIQAENLSNPAKQLYLAKFLNKTFLLRL